VVLMVSVPLSALVVLNAATLIPLLFSDKYNQSIPALQILCLMIPLTSLLTVTTPHLWHLGRAWAVTKLSLFCVILNPGLNYFLLPLGVATFGNGGAGTVAASTTLFTEVIVSIVTFWLLGKAGMDRSTLKLLGKLAVACAATAAAHFWLPVPAVWAMVTDSVIYAVVAGGLGALPLATVISKVTRKLGLGRA
jgi:O-antigen/teichoic acid export membrane protein